MPPMMDCAVDSVLHHRVFDYAETSGSRRARGSGDDHGIDTFRVRRAEWITVAPVTCWSSHTPIS